MLGMTPRQPPTQVKELRESWKFETGDYIQEVAWSPTGLTVAAITVEGAVWLWRLGDDSQRGIRAGEHAGGGSRLSWHVDGTVLATAGHDGHVRLWRETDGVALGAWPVGADWVERVRYSPKGVHLAAAAGRSLRIWSAAGELIYESAEHDSTIADIDWNPDGSGLAVAAYNGVTLHILSRNLPPRKLMWKGSSLAIAWSPNRRYIATGEQDCTVHFWEVRSGEDSRMSGYPTKVLQLSWHHSGRWLATGGSDSIVLWDCQGTGPQGRQPQIHSGHPGKLTQLRFEPAGNRLASADALGVVCLWELPRKSQPLAMGIVASEITSLCWSPDRSSLLVGDRRGQVTTFDLR
jgi:WD40 repeat protein